MIEGWGADELRDGPELARQALARFAVPAERETHELVITHSFLIGWFVRDALGAPPERWMGINTGNAAACPSSGRRPRLSVLRPPSRAATSAATPPRPGSRPAPTAEPQPPGGSG